MRAVEQSSEIGISVTVFSVVELHFCTHARILVAFHGVLGSMWNPIVCDIQLTRVAGSQHLRKAESQFTYCCQNCPFIIISENKVFQQVASWKDF